MSTLIEYSNSISDILCKDIIKLFEKKKINYFEIPKNDDVWKRTEKFLYNELLTKINSYKNTFINTNKNIELPEDIYLNKFTIQKYMNYNDVQNNRTNSRYTVCNFIFFLNTAEVCNKIIINGKTINTTSGKLLIFMDEDSYNIKSINTDLQYIIYGQITSELI